MVAVQTYRLRRKSNVLNLVLQSRVIKKAPVEGAFLLLQKKPPHKAEVEGYFQI